MAEILEESQSLESTTVGIFRTATVVKGGRRFSFGALVVVGDRRGNVGIGYGKGRGVPAAIEKAQKDARKSMFSVPTVGGTLPHPVTGRFGSSKVRLLPAAPGTGVVAGGTVRAVLEMAGIHDCLTKAYGSTNKKNLAKAVLDGLGNLQSRQVMERIRGKELGHSAVEQMLEESRRSLNEQQAATAEPSAATQTQAQNEAAKPEAKAEAPAAAPEAATPATAEAATPEAPAQTQAPAQPETPADNGGEESKAGE